MSDDICVLSHRSEPERLRRAADGLHVCLGCLDRLERALAELPANYADLARRLAPSGGKGGPQVTGTRERALPIDPTVADHREHIARTLVSWALMVAEERGIHPPTHNDPDVTAPWLLVHLRWACAQPWIDDYAAELAALRGRAMALLYPNGRRRVAVGLCIEEGCEGALVATVAPTDDLLPSEIACTMEESHVWTPGRWPELGRRLHGAAGFDARVAAEFMEMIRSA